MDTVLHPSSRAKGAILGKQDSVTTALFSDTKDLVPATGLEGESIDEAVSG